jgi:hypothetical protein
MATQYEQLLTELQEQQQNLQKEKDTVAKDLISVQEKIYDELLCCRESDIDVKIETEWNDWIKQFHCICQQLSSVSRKLANLLLYGSHLDWLCKLQDSFREILENDLEFIKSYESSGISNEALECVRKNCQSHKNYIDSLNQEIQDEKKRLGI